jgi:hypothetical protein
MGRRGVSARRLVCSGGMFNPRGVFRAAGSAVRRGVTSRWGAHMYNAGVKHAVGALRADSVAV